MKESVDAASDQYFTVLNACKTLLTDYIIMLPFTHSHGYTLMHAIIH